MSGLLRNIALCITCGRVFNSYLESFIVMFFNTLSRLFKFSSFSLVNITFGFSLYEMDV